MWIQNTNAQLQVVNLYQNTGFKSWLPGIETQIRLRFGMARIINIKLRLNLGLDLLEWVSFVLESEVSRISKIFVFKYIASDFYILSPILCIAEIFRTNLCSCDVNSQRFFVVKKLAWLILRSHKGIYI